HQSPDQKEDLTTLTACLKMLDDKGYTVQFQASQENKIKSLTTERIYAPEDVKIVNFYRFEGESNPDDNSILYAIETTSGEHGTLIDSYGSDNDVNITDFIKAVEDIHKKVDKKETL
ncbi:MAG TPA: hypothetical protein VK796_00700, partial [Cytophaga sp.]|nr:hypothetical protein [Cytophaga sp.]